MVGVVAAGIGLACVVSAGSSLGNKQILGGDGLLSGKGVRYTNVVSRGTPVMRPAYTRTASYRPVSYASTTYHSGSSVVNGGVVTAMDHEPFSGNRAAVSGDIVGSAVQLPASVATHYETGGSALGESLGLVPLTSGTFADGRDTNLLTPGRLQYLDLPGFPRFESDGYIVHDQRGRSANVCPAGGCTGPTELGPELQAMYDKYKRYYRDNAGAAIPAMAPLRDPVPFAAYNRVPSSSGVHYSTQPLVDHRAGRTPLQSLGSAIPGAAIGRTRNGAIDRVQLGGVTKGARDSFFGKIYDAPDAVHVQDLVHDDVAGHNGSSSNYMSGSRLPGSHYSATGHPEYAKVPGRQYSTGTEESHRPLNDRIEQIKADVQNGVPPRIAEGGILDDIQDLGEAPILDGLEQLADTPIMDNIRKAVG